MYAFIASVSPYTCAYLYVLTIIYSNNVATAGRFRGLSWINCYSVDRMSSPMRGASRAGSIVSSKKWVCLDGCRNFNSNWYLKKGYTILVA
jgi:hypothetical protein